MVAVANEHIQNHMEEKKEIKIILKNLTNLKDQTEKKLPKRKNNFIILLYYGFSTTVYTIIF
jgi:hypothetical protein